MQEHREIEPQKPWLVIICVYFGRWPAWMNFFVESCKWNPEVHWRIYTDCGEPENRADNITFIPVSFADYAANARERLNIAFEPANPFKLCDLRPAFGVLHESEIAAYPFYGHGDIDVIYGNIEKFYGALRDDYDVMSTHPERASGHFLVIRNTPALRRAYELIPSYAEVLADPHQTGIEESGYTPVLRNVVGDRALFVERYSTVLSTRGWHDGTLEYPSHWTWRAGRLTNNRDGEREFLYLHFMRWQASHWINDPPLPGEAAWVGREIIHLDWRRGAAEGFQISAHGFTPAP